MTGGSATNGGHLADAPAERRLTRPTYREVLAVAAFALTNVLVLAHAGGPLRSAVGLPVAVVLPGALALRALGDTRTGWDWVVRAVALSLAGLLAVSAVLGLLPGGALSERGSLAGLDTLVAALTLVGWLWRRRPGHGTEAAGPGPPAGYDAARGLLLSRRRTSRAAGAGPAGARAARTAEVVGAASVLFGGTAVGLAVSGAHRLNGGGAATLTEFALLCAATALPLAALAARHPRGVPAAATGLYALGAAVLLATSLRGTGVTGHDIKVEYRVFTDTLSGGSWHPGGPFVAYNSCLSLTVLPTFLARLLGLSAVDVFRVCFQLLFAIVPVGAFLIARRLLPGPYPVLAAGLFVAFPAFANDMPMLNRQEIALVFFTVALLALLDGAGAGRAGRALLVVLAAGLTVSHYTSSYVAAGCLLVAWTLQRLRAPRQPPAAGRPGAGLGLTAATLVVSSVAWAALTGNAATLGHQLHDAAAAVLARARVTSGATGYSFLDRGAELSDSEALALYVSALRRGAGASPAVSPQCRPRPLPVDRLPVTAAGAALARAGLDPGVANATLRLGAVVVFEGGAVAGSALLWWQTRCRSARRGAAPEVGGPRPAAELLAVLAAGALALLAGTVVAPQLSDSYGLLRLYQQLLAVLGVAVVFAVAAPLHRLAGGGRRRWAAGLAGPVTGAAVVGCLLTTSGLIPQLTGGYPPQLNLNNAGSYFRAYYDGPGDVAAADWIRGHLSPGAAVVADTRDAGNLRSMTRLLPREGLVPGGASADDFVDLTTPDGRSVVAVASIGDRVLRYSFPLGCVTAGRPVVHRTGPHRVYGPVAAT